MAEKNKGPDRANPDRGLDANRPSAFYILFMTQLLDYVPVCFDREILV